MFQKLFGFYPEEEKQVEKPYSIEDLVIDLVNKFGIKELHELSQNKIENLLKDGVYLNIESTEYSIYINLYAGGNVYQCDILKNKEVLGGGEEFGRTILDYINLYYEEEQRRIDSFFAKKLQMIIVEDRKKYLASSVEKEFSEYVFDELKELDTITKRANEILEKHLKAKAELVP